MDEREEPMRVGIVGLGYVGLVTAVVLADRGNEIVGVDIDDSKIEKLRIGEPTIFEPGLDTLLKKNLHRITFTTSYKMIANSEAIFIAVPTPNRDGKINLDYVFGAIEQIKSNAPEVPIAIKSTVVPGTAAAVFKNTGIRIVSNPEFLREGSAIIDTNSPERIVVGGVDKHSKEIFKNVWAFTQAPVIDTTNENAELIKYASNAFLATKISFINEIANLCEKIPGADVKVVATGMGFDKRIAPYFLNAGLGFGGSCFPKDTQAIVSYSNNLHEKLTVVESAIRVNSERITHNLNRIESMYGKLKGRNVCILGIAFKDDTDDVRSSKSWELALEMKERGANVTAYDPAISNIDEIELVNSPKECVEKCDLIVVATEWKSFRDLDFGDNKIVIDLRGIMDTVSMAVGKYVTD